MEAARRVLTGTNFSESEGPGGSGTTAPRLPGDIFRA
jgi:hypothetical protein